jgi:hypothetical protein
MAGFIVWLGVLMARRLLQVVAIALSSFGTNRVKISGRSKGIRVRLKV